MRHSRSSGTETPDNKRSEVLLIRGFGTTPPAAVGITCPKYEPAAGTKRCQHYWSNGSCALPTEFMCIEYLKRNGHQTALRAHQEAVPPARALFAQPHASVPPERSGARSKPTAKPVAVELALELGGTQLHLVSGYTPAPRMELSWEHAATLRRILDAFPGARLVGFGPDLTPSSSPPGEQP